MSKLHFAHRHVSENVDSPGGVRVFVGPSGCASENAAIFIDFGTKCVEQKKLGNFFLGPK